MATVTKPIALDESLNTTESPSRNIADVIAQGLANLSTAVKPNASNILMSDNITTVEQAITALQNPDSISVTADGVKTYTLLLNELYALTDFSKASSKTTLKFGGVVYQCVRISSTYGRFSWTEVGGSDVKHETIRFQSTSSYYSATTTTSGTTFTALSSTVPTNGTKIELFY